MKARTSYRIGLAAMIAYVVACASPLATFVRAAGYVAGIAKREIPQTWEMANWALILGGAAGTLGGIACVEAARRMRLRVRNYAVAAVWTGVVGTSAAVLGSGWVDGARDLLYYNPVRRSTCQSNLKQIGLAVLMYAQDYDDRMPFENRWNESTLPYIKNEYTYRCPEAAASPSIPSYGFLRGMGGAPSKLIAEQDRTVMLFDSRLGKDVSGGMGSLPVPPRHKDGHNIGFVDGHVGFTRTEGIPVLKWKPTFEPQPSTHGSSQKPR